MRSLTWMFAVCLFVPAALADEPDDVNEPNHPEDQVGPEPVAVTLLSAEDAVTEVAALEAKVAQHRTDKDDRGLVNDLGDAVDLCKRISEPKTKERLNALLGVVLEATKNDTLKKEAFKAIASIGDPANWRHVRPYVRQPDPKSGPPLLKEAIDCAGRLKAEGAVEPLLAIVSKSKVHSFAGAAITALGNYGELKRVRVRILATMVDELRGSVPSAGGGMKKGGQSADGKYGSTNGGGSGESSRWDALSPLFVVAANKMTGKNVGTAEDWFEIYDTSKGREAALFER